MEGDALAGGAYNPFQHPLVFVLDDYLAGKPSADGGRQGAYANHSSVEESFVSNQEHQIALQVVQQRRKLPPVLNDKALFTRAATYGDRADQSYHAPSNRIGVHYSPASMAAAGMLFEEFPQDPQAPRTKAGTSPKALGEVCSSYSSNRPISPNHTGPLSPPAAAGRPVRPNHAQSRASTTTLMSQSASLHQQLMQQHAGDQLTQQQQHQGQPWQAGSPMAADEAAIVDALLRYHYYAEMGIDPRQVAPFREEWVGNALSMVPNEPPPNVSQAFFDDFISNSLDEVRSDYTKAMQKAIVDYVIASPLERQRLGLEGLEPLLVPRNLGRGPLGPSLGLSSHQRVVQRQLPKDWHEHVMLAREDIAWTLQTLSPNALELSRLWHECGYASARLLDVATVDLLERLPVKADWFRGYQQSATEQVKGQLWSHWLPKCLDVFRRLPPVPINGDTDAYFRAVATLQSNQLRGLVSNTLQDYLAFFRQHKAVHPLDPQQDQQLWSCLPVFEMDLTATIQGRVGFEPSVQDAQVAVLSVVEAAVYAALGLPKISPASISNSTLSAPPAVTNAAALASNPTVISGTALNENFVQNTVKELLAILEANQAAPLELAALFEPYLYLLQLNPELYAYSFAEGAGGKDAPDLTKFGAEIERLQQAAQAVRLLCTESVRTGLYLVQCRKFKDQLIAAAEAAVHDLLDVVCTAARESNLKVFDQYQVMTAEVGKPANSGEEVLALKKLISKCNIDNEKLKEEIAVNKSRDDFLLRFRFPVPDDDFDFARKAYEWPKRFSDVLREAGTKAASEHRQFEGALKARRREFDKRIEQYAAEVAAVEGRADIVKREVVASEVTELQAKLQAAVQEAEEINIQEKMFGWGTTKYGHVSSLLSTLEPYVTLWTTMNDFYNHYAAWMNGPFWKLNPEQVEAESSEAYRKLFKLTKTFGGGTTGEAKQQPLAVAEEGRAKITAFQGYIPLINAVCNQGLRERHWAAIAEVVGFEIKQDEVTSLKRLLDNEIMEHLERVTELSDSASREFSIEKALDKMSADWEGLAFELGTWKNTGTHILKGGPVEEAQMLLDDHVVKSQAMAASPFSKPFEERLVPWEKKLRTFQEMLEEWLTCQGKWLYLEPIFSADEIMKQIPREGTAFRTMDATWRRIMAQVHEQPLMMAVADIPELLDQLKECNRQLDVVEKGLNDFLETKKMAFPRFYFLSNDELLEILSEAKDPLAVQPFVKKCFEAVKELVFEQNGEISGMVSLEGEKITFVERVNPATTGAVESWLLEVEGAIKRTMHSITREALTAYPKTARTTWILQWPGQLVLNGSQVFWTREVTDAIQSGGSKGLSSYAHK
eukprot:GHUV01014078.1.p1 GENE.GHUV01014078.1~~GHUV01014078.1.p1  ORF type:complete len:1340 (+),score=424.03 GHUV01014078.1:252-4271(+)